ncbi:MAG: alpha/beta hydrolase family protein [Isosphaeraceae bacterium]
MPRPRRWLSLVLVLGAAGADGARGADPVASALARSVIGPRQTLAETQDHCEARITRLPEVKSLEDWEDHARRTRAKILENVVFRGEANAWRTAKTRVEWLETVPGGPGYRIKKLRYEALPGLWVPALLYEPEDLAKRGEVPVVLNVNGHDRQGKAAPYKQVRCINQAKRGMLALNIEWFNMGQFVGGDYRHDLINHLDLCGTSGLGAFYLLMTRGIDLLLSLEGADPDRVAVTGLSGGGWQTIVVSALDTRVTLANPVAGYSSFLTRSRKFSDLGDSEQTPNDFASVSDYAELTALMAPRPLLLTYNLKDDCCFASGHALPPLLEAAGPVYKLFGKAENLRSHVNEDPGTHNYLLDNRQALYRMLADHFGEGAPEEIPSDDEVKTPEQLTVPLPEDNASLHSLARSLSAALPRRSALPDAPEAARAWRDEARGRLRAVVRAGSHEATVVSRSTETAEGVTSTAWRLRVGSWSVPLVELAREGVEPKGTTLLIRDKGRGSSADAVKALLAEGCRVLAVDPFYVGEAKLAEKDYLFALLLASVGDRPLGVQAGQIAAVARWARRERGGEAVELRADGPRTSIMALVAAGLEPEAIGELELRESLGSLKELIESKAAFNDAPELYCFGLLEEFDVAQLAALSAPRPLTFVGPSERARAELSGLKAWNRTWGLDHDPLR